jgi:hypothetical protein
VVDACKEVLWMRNFLQELDMKQEKYTLYCDSQSAIYLAKNPSFHAQTKHIEKIHTDNNGLDMMTKILP